MLQTTVHKVAKSGEQDLIVFRVADDVFVCSRAVFMSSGTFRSIMESTQSFREKPVELNGITVEEFDLFTWVLHATNTDMEMDERVSEAGTWVAVHRLSSLWDFPIVSQLALAKTKCLQLEDRLRRLESSKDASKVMADAVSGMMDDPLGGVAGIMGGMGKGAGTLVSGAVMLPFAIASTPFIGISKAFRGAGSKAS